MKIMYIAPMFHTNQVPIVKGWLECGDSVIFLSQYQGNTENHSYCKPMILGYSSLFRIINRLYSNLQKNRGALSSYPEKFRDRYGFPPLYKLTKFLRQQQPDIVILRERSIYCIVTYLVCKLYNFKCILYNQTPLWETEPPRNDVFHKVVRHLTPRIRMTPVYGNEKKGYKDIHSYYVPFVIQPHTGPSEKTYFLHNRINILCVGKFEERKNQLMLLQILFELKPFLPLHLILVGELSTPHHMICFQKIKEYIQTHNLEENISLHSNCAPEEMHSFYNSSDLFVLPSTGEFASISHLEAMSHSLPVIVSNTNGTACYIEPGKNGYVFKDNDYQDLKKSVTSLVSNRNLILKMGAHSYTLVTEKYSFSNYKKNIKQLVELSDMQ